MTINWLNCIVLLPLALLMGAGIYTLIPNVYGPLVGFIAGVILGLFTAHRGIYLFVYQKG